MNLRKYDNKCVRIIAIDDKYYDGICSFNSREYNEHEYGKEEESLQILNIIFYKSFIKKIEELEHFSNTEYGALEELIVDLENGPEINFIEDALDYEEEVHNDRLLLCIEEHINDFKDKEAIERLIKKYTK